SSNASHLPYRITPPPSRSTLSFFYSAAPPRALHSFPTRRSSDLDLPGEREGPRVERSRPRDPADRCVGARNTDQLGLGGDFVRRSEEHTSELQSLTNLVCRLLLEKKNEKKLAHTVCRVHRHCDLT